MYINYTDMELAMNLANAQEPKVEATEDKAVCQMTELAWAAI